MANWTADVIFVFTLTAKNDYNKKKWVVTLGLWFQRLALGKGSVNSLTAKESARRQCGLTVQLKMPLSMSSAVNSLNCRAHTHTHKHTHTHTHSHTHTHTHTHLQFSEQNKLQNCPGSFHLLHFYRQLNSMEVSEHDSQMVCLPFVAIKHGFIHICDKPCVFFQLI